MSSVTKPRIYDISTIDNRTGIGYGGCDFQNCEGTKMRVQPLYEYTDVLNVQSILGEKWGNVREGECFFIACHIGLRACDLLELKFEQFKKNHIKVIEKKTGKTRIIIQTDVLRKSIVTLKTWYKEKGIEPVYLFQATSRCSAKRQKPISQTYYYKKINEACEAIGIDQNVGTHTARKTFGYHLYKQTGNLAIVQDILNHASEKETLKYIGVSDKRTRDAVASLDFSKPCEVK
jgi:integrase